MIASRAAAMAVPLMDIKAQYGPLRAGDRRRHRRVLDSGPSSSGPKARRSGGRLRAARGPPRVGVANGADALSSR